MSPTMKTALRWSLMALAAVILLTVVTTGWGRLWSWVPWSTASRAERAETRADTAESDAAARGIESTARGEQIERIEAAGQIRIQVEAVTAAAIAQARGAEDAETPLEPARAGRLRDADRQLCELAPGSCAAATPDAP